MTDEEKYYCIALTRISGISSQMALQLYQAVGDAKTIYENRKDIRALIDDCQPRLVAALKNWDNALAHAAVEMDFAKKHDIRILTMNDEVYPMRLRECPDAPVVLYYKGNATLNQRRVINIVGTRHCTAYGKDLVIHFVKDLQQYCTELLIVSGLAYGIDVCAHRQALSSGYETVGVLAHGLDTIYPSAHREVAIAMLNHGGLLTEYSTQTQPLPNNFRQRNRIVAGISDATIVIESAYKGGALITARIAQEYGRDIMAFPGAVGAAFSEGCNQLIRDNKAALITSAEDFINAIGWQSDMQREKAKTAGIERQLFPDLTPDEKAIVQLLQQTNDLQMNTLSVRTNIAIGPLTALLFQLEMKGVVRPLAGGTYHLII